MEGYPLAVCFSHINNFMILYSNEKNGLQQFQMESCQPIKRLKDKNKKKCPKTSAHPRISTGLSYHCRPQFKMNIIKVLLK
jgi:hypothetical protein